MSLNALCFTAYLLLAEFPSDLHHLLPAVFILANIPLIPTSLKIAFSPVSLLEQEEEEGEEEEEERKTNKRGRGKNMQRNRGIRTHTG